MSGVTLKYTVNAGIAKGFGGNLQHTMKILLLGEKKRKTTRERGL